MNILYWTLSTRDINGSVPYGEKADYQSDLSFFGLRELFGEKVVDIPKKEHLYHPYPRKGELWGRGFGYGGKLDDIEVDRDDIENKIRNNFFDAIVVSPHHTTAHTPQIIFDSVYRLSEISRSKIIVIDGQDNNPAYWPCLEVTPYCFRREIRNEQEDKFIPIGFCLPEFNFIESLTPKNRMTAYIVPSDHNGPNRVTHIYNNEESYYKGYQDSWFGLTCVKGGADCARHVEIIMNGCIPIFTDIENVYPSTLKFLPRKLLSDIKDWPFLRLPRKTFTKHEIKLEYDYVDHDRFDEQLCVDTANYLLEYGKKHLTTKALGNYIINKVFRNA